MTGTGCWYATSRTTQSSCWIPQATSSARTRAPNASKATQKKKSSANTSPSSTQQKTQENQNANSAKPSPTADSKTKAGASAKTAPDSGPMSSSPHSSTT